LGPILYLCVYLAAFAWDTLALRDRVEVALIAWWATASHATHLLLAAGLCLPVAAVLLLHRQRPHGAVGRVVAIVLGAALAQVALHTYLYGKPSLSGKDRPPFLLARVIADGPGRSYLRQHCGELKLAICDYVERLPDNFGDFLWAPNGIWQTALLSRQDL